MNQANGRKVLQEKVDPEAIAEEFIIQELIKMFPGAREEFYDSVRYFGREYRHKYNKDRFWRLVEGFSAYMLKRYYRMLRGKEYRWSLEEIPLKDIYIKAFHGTSDIAKLVKENGYNALKVGEKLRSYPPEKRMQVIDPFKFSKDNYPIIVEEEKSGEIIVHDGNRRALNFAIYGFPTVKAYVGRKSKKGKPAIPENFFTNLMSVVADNGKITNEMMNGVSLLLKSAKNNYTNGPRMVDMYIKDHFLGLVQNNQQKKMLEDILA